MAETQSLEATPSLNGRKAEHMGKLLLSLREESLQTITYEARARGISVQELLRAVIIPDWVRDNMRPRSVQTLISSTAGKRRVPGSTDQPRSWDPRD